MSNNAIYARIANNGNIKLGSHMGTFSKLYSDAVFDTKYGPVTGTCGGHCEGCKNKCYVKASYRYDSVINCHARNTLAFRNNILEAFEQIWRQLERKRKPYETVRINQSGEIETFNEFTLWIETAIRHPETNFYLYTKNYDVIRDAVKYRVDVPENFTVLISIWHEYGIKEYFEFKHLAWIKAFVYMDGFNYSAYGLDIETTCKAYENGKLNHDITCERCQKCINSQFKVIGCNEH